MDNYYKIRVLGKGGYGTAYLMKSKESGKLVCIKEVSIPPGLLNNKTSSHIEIRILQNVSPHPNVIQYISSFISQSDSIKQHSHLYIVTPYYPGGDLHQYLQKHRKRYSISIPESKICYWFIQICLAVHHLHASNIIHRDLKTKNVFLMDNDHLVLGDFGISKVLSNNRSLSETFVGTPYFMSPEQLRHQPYDLKSDIWSLGCLLWELCTMQYPFRANSMEELRRKILSRENISLPENTYSTWLIELLHKMLSHSPSLRPTSSQILKIPQLGKYIQAYYQKFSKKDYESGYNLKRQIEDLGINIQFKEKIHGLLNVGNKYYKQEEKVKKNENHETIEEDQEYGSKKDHKQILLIKEVVHQIKLQEQKIAAIKQPEQHSSSTDAIILRNNFETESIQEDILSTFCPPVQRMTCPNINPGIPKCKNKPNPLHPTMRHRQGVPISKAAIQKFQNKCQDVSILRKNEYMRAAARREFSNLSLSRIILPT